MAEHVKAKGIDDALRDGVDIEEVKGDDAIAHVDRMADQHGLSPDSDGVASPTEDKKEVDRKKVQKTLEQLQHPLTELGNAERLVERHGQDIHFCPGTGILVWVGTHWQHDLTNKVQELAKETVRTIPDEIQEMDLSNLSSGEKTAVREKLENWAERSEKQRMLNAMMTLASSDPKIVVLPDQLDAKPFAFNCLNGTLFFTRNGKVTLKPHERSDLITRLAPVPYDPKAGSSRIADFFRWVSNDREELHAYLVRVLGSGTVGDSKGGDGVKIIEPRCCPGLPEREMGTLFRKPELIGQDFPSIIIGHDHITGPYAIALRDDYFPNAKAVIFVHVSGRELEFHKEHEGRDPAAEAMKKHATQKAVILAADMVVAVGPHLQEQTGTLIRELNVRNESSKSQIPTSFRLDPGMDTDLGQRVQGVPDECEVLQVGRTQHIEQKGFDIAAKALGKLSNTKRKITFVVRGCGTRESKEIQKTLNEKANNTSLRIRPLPFDPNPYEVRGDLGRASLLIMPSREEGFGLVGLEAIEVGVPILVTGRSGLAYLLKEMLGEEDAASFIVETDDSKEWADRIGAVLSAPDVSFKMAERLRAEIAPKLTWQAAAIRLEQEWDRRFPVA